MRAFLLAILLACTTAPEPRGESQAASDPPARTPAVPKDSPHYDLFEGTSHANACKKDDECHAGGCSHEVCSADPSVKTPCIFHDDAPKEASCGCVENVCIWYR